MTTIWNQNHTALLTCCLLALANPLMRFPDGRYPPSARKPTHDGPFLSHADASRFLIQINALASKKHTVLMPLLRHGHDDHLRPPARQQRGLFFE